MQCAVIEAARNLAGISRTPTVRSSTCRRPHPVIYLIEQWFDYRTQSVQKRDLSCDKGGSMRLGSYPCKIEKGTLAYEAYGKERDRRAPSSPV